MKPGTLLRSEPTPFAGSLVAWARHRERFRGSSGAAERRGHLTCRAGEPRIESGPETDHIRTMRTLRVSEDIVPIAQFKARAGRWLERARDTGHPVVITRNGKPAGVLLSPVEFDDLQERLRLFVDIAAGVADAEAGRVFTTEQVRRRLARRRPGGTAR